jgi:hypothetical protein
MAERSSSETTIIYDQLQANTKAIDDLRERVASEGRRAEVAITDLAGKVAGLTDKVEQLRDETHRDSLSSTGALTELESRVVALEAARAAAMAREDWREGSTARAQQLAQEAALTAAETRGTARAFWAVHGGWLKVLGALIVAAITGVVGWLFGKGRS